MRNAWAHRQGGVDTSHRHAASSPAAAGIRGAFVEGSESLRPAVRPLAVQTAGNLFPTTVARTGLDAGGKARAVPRFFGLAQMVGPDVCWDTSRGSEPLPGAGHLLACVFGALRRSACRASRIRTTQKPMAIATTCWMSTGLCSTTSVPTLNPTMAAMAPVRPRPRSRLRATAVARAQAPDDAPPSCSVNARCGRRDRPCPRRYARR